MNSSEWYIAGLDDVPKIEVRQAQSWRQPNPPKLTPEEAFRAGIIGLLMFVFGLGFLIISFLW